MTDLLEGKLVRLRPVEERDLPYLASLKNDLRTQGWSQRLPPKYTPALVAERYKKQNEGKNSAVLVAETLGGVLLGTVNYSEERPRVWASMGISIGTEHWGKGYAEEAQELLLRFLFAERGLAAVRIWTQSGNERAVRAAQKLGFRISARARQGVVNMERVGDSLMMDLLREEYFASRKMEDKIKTGCWLTK